MVSSWSLSSISTSEISDDRDGVSEPLASSASGAFTESTDQVDHATRTTSTMIMARTDSRTSACHAFDQNDFFGAGAAGTTRHGAVIHASCWARCNASRSSMTLEIAVEKA